MQATHRGLQPGEAGGGGGGSAEARSAANSVTSATVTSLESADAARGEPADVAGEISPVGRDRVVGQAALDRDVPQIRVHRPVELHVSPPGPVASRRRMLGRGEHADRQDAVAQAPLQHAGDGILQGNPLDPDVGLFGLPRVGCAYRRQSAREEDVHDLVVAAGGREDGQERLPVGGRQIGFFDELALGRLERGLPRDVEQAGGDLPVAVADRVSVLLDQQDAFVLVHRDDRRRTGVLDVLAHDLAVAVADGVVAHVPDAALSTPGRSR